MTSCVRHDPCMAFNHHVLNKTCILLPDVKCMEPRSFNDSSYLFVQLEACRQQPSWLSVRPLDHSWKWISTEDPSNNADIIWLQSVFTRYVSRTLYRGQYLPGWWSTKGRGFLFRAVDPATQQVTKCPHGEFLAFSDSSSYTWTPYATGDPLPSCALALSQLSDGTSLYIVRYQYPDEKIQRISGFYNHVTKSSYCVYTDVLKPSAVFILCGTNI